METITRSCVRLGVQVASKAEAIRLAGEALFQAGYIAADYRESFSRRETMANTYLGSGVAIPHGTVDDRHLVKHTGIAVLQIPAGVEWNAGQRATLVVAIAAQSDEHIAILRRLTRLMQQPEMLETLVHTQDVDVLIAALTGQTAAPAPAAASAWPADAETRWTLDYPSGLHARPATRWVEAARRFNCELRAQCGDELADLRSLTALLSLGATAGSALRFLARGDGAQRAVEVMLETARALSAEEKDSAERAKRNALAARRAAPEWQPQAACQSVLGLGASAGLAIGKLVRHSSQSFDVVDQPGDIERDGVALESALLAVRDELAQLEADTKTRLGAAEAAIFAAHRELLNDAALVRNALALIMKGHGGAWAWHSALQTAVAALEKLADPLLAARALDLRDVGERVLGRLLGTERKRLVLTEPSILVAEDLTPSDTLHLDTRFVAGLAISGGGPTSHTAILARTLGLPAIVGAGPALLTAEEGQCAVVDGSAGCIYLGVGQADQQAVVQVIARQQADREALRAERHQSARTTDGHVTEIAANVANPKQAEQALAAGAEGVGLMRTEFLFLERDTAPSEDEQYEVYRRMVQIMDGRTLIIRTLDIGGDKQVPYLDLPKEENPFLGVRGARLQLQRQDLLYPQLRALYRAAKLGPLSIMFPMVTHIQEVEALREHCERVRAELDAPQVKLGIMVEVPAVAVMANRFAQVVDFFSIGTNDLTQYTLAMDRQHPELASQADSLHPAVLALIDTTVRAAHAHGKWVGVCGGLAGDTLGAKLLMGLGVDELSMSAQDVAGVKHALRHDSLVAMQALAQRALIAQSAAEVRAL